ncbi:MAG: DNA mismatch repair endonuclease MutL [Phycisphaerales bacterium]|nr:DNA mismatch repair endonuclease MutL [Phycisphaerales bacterium]
MAVSTPETLPTIRALDPLVINQIAAGEVVERPASVVKELVENALDAGATQITVELEAGGIELVRVADDGCGMMPEQLPMAVAPHATSKITSPNDLDAVATMGFRGEALASIASVSRLRIRSRPAGASEASELRVEGDVVEGPLPASGALGTVIEVRNLFFNTPARRKFLRTAQTEKQRCVEAVKGLALARPAIGFKLTCDGHTTLDLPANQSAPDRVRSILGQDLAEAMIEATGVAAETYNVNLWGLVGRPHAARGNAKGQWIVLNGRVVRDATIAHALREAYRGLIEPGKHPVAVLLIDIDPSMVDVNVHPAKAEVRFRDSSAIHAAVHGSVREALAGEDLTASFTEVNPSAARPWQPFVPADGAIFTGTRAADLTNEARELADRLTDAEVHAVLSRTEPQPQALVEPKDPSTDSSIEPAPIDRAPDGPWMRRAMQIRDSYLVAPDGSGDGVVIIDQHALHERVMFEALRSRIASHGDLESQRLLTPAMVGVADAPEKLEALAPILYTLGIDATAAGPTRVAVHAFPSLLFSRGVDPAEFMAELLEADDLPKDQEDALREVLDMMACKAAVKAGDALSDQELSALLELREKVERSASCPHGRPTSIRLTMRDLERMFGRR